MAQNPKVLVALGDSLTAGYGLRAGEAYPELLAQRLAQAGCAVRVINAGVSGDTSAGGLTRLEWVLQDKPDMAIVALGANDALRGLPPEAMERNLGSILSTLAQRKVPVLLAGMVAPPNLGADYGRRYAAVFPRLAAAHGTRLYPFLLEGVAARPELNQADGIHPNAAGARELTSRLFVQVLELAKSCGACPP